MPPHLEHLVGWFAELRAAKAAGEPVEWRDLEAWAGMTGRQVSPDDAQLLMQMDHAFRTGAD